MDLNYEDNELNASDDLNDEDNELIASDQDNKLIDEVKSVSKALGQQEWGAEGTKERLIQKAKLLIQKIDEKEIIKMVRTAFIEGMLEADGISSDKKKIWVDIMLTRPRVIFNTLNFYLYTVINDIKFK